MSSEESNQIQNNEVTIKTEDVSNYFTHSNDTTGKTDETTNNFQWDPASTRMMLTLRFQRQVEFVEHVRPKKELWDEIANLMKTHGGHQVTADICDLKYRNMLQTYKKNRIKEIRGLDSLIAWEYYDMFKNAIEMKTEIMDLIPTLLCDTVVNRDYEDCNLSINNMGDDGDASTLSKSSTDIKRKRQKGKKRKRHEQSMQNEAEQGLPSAVQSCSDRIPSLSKSQRLSSSSHSQAEQMQTYPQSNNLDSSSTSAFQTSGVVMAEAVSSQWLNSSELQECRIFGESIGAQLCLVKDAQVRALVQLKIQELLYAAKVGILVDK